MKSTSLVIVALLSLAAWAPAAEPLKVNALNFARAETDMYFTRMVHQAGGLAKFYHLREPTPLDKQDVIRMQRDTLYSSAIFDVEAGPVTLTLPQAGKRFMSLLIVNQDHYATEVHYAPGKFDFTRATIGTRYFAALVRTFVDPANAADLKAAHALQDAITVQQANIGAFETPTWDPVTHERTRKLLLELSTLGSSENRFGRKDEVDTISWLLGTAAGWGGNPPKAAIYFPIVPTRNDGRTAYTLTLKDVPVDGFWSVTVYDADGYMFANEHNAYSVNSVTAKPESDGSFKIQFGGDPKNTLNFLATKAGWNGLLRLYRPRNEILNGTWKQPAIQPAN